jgi:hypothetical protein
MSIAMEEKRILKKNFFSGFKLNLSSYNPKRKNEDIKKKIDINSLVVIS